jgi:hypothetical protein
MSEQPVGMRYLGGWGGDFEAEVQTAALPAQAQVLEMFLKRLRLRALKDREYIYKRWQKRYETMTQTLFDESDLQQILQEDTYLKKVRRNLNLT